MIEAGSGRLLGVQLIPASHGEVAAITLQEGSLVKYDKLHAMLGRPGAQSVQCTAQALGLEIARRADKCIACAQANMKQKNIPKENEKWSTIPGERLTFDTTSVKSLSYGGNKFWSLAVDDATGLPFSAFLACKTNVKDHIILMIHELRDKGKTVKYILCDIAGENLKLQEAYN